MKVWDETGLKPMRAALAKWYGGAARDLPWRRTRDPYRIWISEVMLQQTRVAAVLPYYHRFLELFPNVEALARAPEPQLLNAWAGLGYYSRARNAQKAARQILETGHFPKDYASIRNLAGVGDYTAAAVASIAFGQGHAVLDGNVIRVLARLLAERGNIRDAKIRQRMAAAACEFLDPRQPSRHNQALMELGAMVCLPKQPDCPNCPLARWCQAHATGLASELPVKTPPAEIRRVERTFLVVIRKGNLLLWQRAKDAKLLPGFWELPEPHQLAGASPGVVLHTFQHAITNTIYTFHVATARARAAPENLIWVSLSKLHDLPLSTACRKALAGLKF